MSKKIVQLKETERALREAVGQLASREERIESLLATARSLEYVESVQRVALVPRLRAHRMMQTVYYYLLKNGQLGRRVGSFDTDVKSWIVQTLEKLRNEILNDNSCVK